MLLERLVVSNFRCFHGRQEIAFATDKNKSLTIIHGENGSGKTNILNGLYWCLTGQFTPRLQNPELLINKAAYDDDRTAECYVELFFTHEDKQYQCVRRVTGRTTNKLELFILDGQKPRSVPNPQQIIEAIIPKGLSQWFFFDAEAIGELELSGSDEFRRSLRRILGFELVDGLVEDLELCQRKLQKNLTHAVNSKELDEIQNRIEEIQHVMPRQRSMASTLDAQVTEKTAQLEAIEAKLRAFPKSQPLQDRRSRLENRRKVQVQLKRDLQAQLALCMGDAGPAILAYQKATALEGQLHIKENSGRLPAPYSDQLVEDILREGTCICGRAVAAHSAEEQKIHRLLRDAATPIFNTRVRAVQLLIKAIAGTCARYVPTREDIVRRIAAADAEIASIDVELKEVRDQLQKLEDSVVQDLERDFSKAKVEFRDLSGKHAVVLERISDNEEELGKLQAKYDNAAKRQGHGAAVQAEIDKLRRLTTFLTKTLKEQEARALNILLAELTHVLETYLTKHYEPRIVPSTYQVTMVDAKGREVGRSTGEGQVLKFAFISTVVALASRKTGPKVDFLADPTVAPLVLDAPFSALDPQYQSSVATNIVAQASQVVLLISSAAWSEGVGSALDPSVGKRYVLISRQEGPRGNKPVKHMTIGRRKILLNEYGAERDETVIEECE